MIANIIPRNATEGDGKLHLADNAHDQGCQQPRLPRLGRNYPTRMKLTNAAKGVLHALHHEFVFTRVYVRSPPPLQYVTGLDGCVAVPLAHINRTG